MVHHGIDMGCCKGEFLSINDGDVYHTELVWYYSQLRWRAVYEVRGELWQDYVICLCGVEWVHAWMQISHFCWSRGPLH